MRPQTVWRRAGDLPRPVRIALYTAVVGALLYICLAPREDIPGANLFWDKWEHLAAWFVLVMAGFVLAPRRPLAICAFALLLGAGVELLQFTMGFGRKGDLLDVVADSLGVATAATVALIARHVRL